jgi:hypothetical protein
MDCNSCSTCIKYKNTENNQQNINQQNINQQNNRKENNIEHFSYEVPKNMCHYGCSNINTTNIILFVLILVLIYLLSREKFLNFFK